MENDEPMPMGTSSPTSNISNAPTPRLCPINAAEASTSERMIASDFSERSEVMLNLRQPSFQTASHVAQAVNQQFGPGTATALSGTQVSLRAPLPSNQRISYMALLEAIDVQEGRTRPKVVFNSRTGTVVVGQGVRVKAAAVSHGNLAVTISETSQVSQPGAFSGGETAVVPRSDVSVNQQRQQDDKRAYKQVVSSGKCNQVINQQKV